MGGGLGRIEITVITKGFVGLYQTPDGIGIPGDDGRFIPKGFGSLGPNRAQTLVYLF
jgi:hypothetical protein